MFALGSKAHLVSLSCLIKVKQKGPRGQRSLIKVWSRSEKRAPGFQWNFTDGFFFWGYGPTEAAYSSLFRAQWWMLFGLVSTLSQFYFGPGRHSGYNCPLHFFGIQNLQASHASTLTWSTAETWGSVIQHSVYKHAHTHPQQFKSCPFFCRNCIDLIN